MVKNTKKQDGGRDRVGFLLYLLYLLALVCAAVIVCALLCIQIIVRPDKEIKARLTPSIVKVKEEPVRGNILATDGRAFALSYTEYTLAMDPSVLKEEFKNDKKDGTALEKEWLSKAKVLSGELSELFPHRSADEYYRIISEGRAAGSRYKVLATGVDYETLQKAKNLTLFNEGANKGGIVIEPKQKRQYPYGKLARRAIGFVRDVKDDKITNNFIGIEGKYDEQLRGKEGYQFTKKVDGNRRVRSYDSTSVKTLNGMDVRTTLNIDYQDLADKALRKQIDTNMKIEGGCAIVMEVKTGAIRAMVNLKRDSSTGRMEEIMNYSVGRAGEPGSVFKLVTLMSLMEDGYVKSMADTVHTNKGRMKYFKNDEHIATYEIKNKKDYISIMEGLDMSSNYVFAYLAEKYYKKNPEVFVNRIRNDYKLGEAYDFDIVGMAKPKVPSPKDKDEWSGPTLGSIGYGYSITETPLHILTFYNAIAGKGKMMKPYMVESVEKNGVIEEKYGPSILKSSICSRSIVDTLTRGLTSVVQNGTATKLKDAKCTVAGKTGTARIALNAEEMKNSTDPYMDLQKRKKNQATFVGFFPAEDPQYSLIVVVYSILDKESFYGGTLPALAAKDIVDGIWSLDPYWRNEIESKGSVPSVGKAKAAHYEENKVPDLKGLGLMDALYIIESNGYKCSYSGTGHIYSQSPQPGTAIKKGDTIKISLK